MANYNKVLLMGNLTRDPEVRQTQGGQSITEFGMAINRTFTVNNEKREETCFVDLKAWGRRGEILAQYCQKGSPLFIEGRLEYSTWEAQDGGKRSKLRVVVDNFQFVGGGRRESGGSMGGEQALDPADFGFDRPPSRPSGGFSDPPPSNSSENEESLPF